MSCWRALTFATLAALGCGDGATAPRNVTVEFMSPMPAEALAGDTLLAAVRVSSAGSAVPGSGVAWRVTAGEGHLVDAVETTNGQGLVSALWVLGSGLEEGALAAAVDDFAVTVRVTTVPRPPFRLSLEMVADSPVATMDAVTLQARLTDALGNPIAGEPVTWSTQIPFPEWGDWAITSVDLAGREVDTTDAEGRADVGMRLPYAADWLLSASTATAGPASRALTVVSRSGFTGTLAWDTTLASHRPIETGATAASDGELVYLMPGRCRYGDCFRFQTPLQVYSPAEDRWRTGSQPPDYPVYSGQGFGVAGVSSEGFHLLYFGRHHVYDPATDVWSERPRLPAGSFGPGVMVDDELLVFTRDATWVYDVATRSWRTSAPMPTPRSGPALVRVGSEVFVAGGAGSTAFERFDSRTETWSRLPEMPGERPMSNAGSAVGDDICIFGGGVDLGRPYRHFQEVYCYGRSTGAWRSETPFPHLCTFWPTAVPVGEDTYVFGGARGEVADGGNNVPCSRVVRLSVGS